MTLTEKQEYNKRCAEFLGGEYRRKESLTYEPKGRWYIDQFPDAEQDYNLKFYSDWNWIMEVVEKIEKLDYWVCIQNTYAGIGKRNDEQPVIGYSYSSLTITKKEAVVSTINKFLIWYSLNDTTNKNRISQ